MEKDCTWLKSQQLVKDSTELPKSLSWLIISDNIKNSKLRISSYIRMKKILRMTRESLRRGSIKFRLRMHQKRLNFAKQLKLFLHFPSSMTEFWDQLRLLLFQIWNMGLNYVGHKCLKAPHCSPWIQAEILLTYQSFRKLPKVLRNSSLTSLNLTVFWS